MDQGGIMASVTFRGHDEEREREREGFTGSKIGELAWVCTRTSQHGFPRD